MERKFTDDPRDAEIADNVLRQAIFLLRWHAARITRSDAGQQSSI